MTEFFPEQTIRYKTYAKQTLVTAISKVFQSHPDELLQRTKVSIEYPKTEVDYPSIVVRLYERSVFNAGVGHTETMYVNGESDSTQVSIDVTTGGTVQLRWDPVKNALGYKVYRTSALDPRAQSFWSQGTTFLDEGQPGKKEPVPAERTAALDTPQPIATILPGQLFPGTYNYWVTAIFPSRAVRFKHYFYNADIEFAVYALSVFDRDLISDALVQTITMGTLEAYTNQFFERIYPTNDLYPDSQLHFININSDQIQGFGESTSQVPWGSEDDMLYQTSYRTNVFGELYSLPPDISYAMIRKITQYPYIGGLEPVYDGAPEDLGSRWISNTTDGS